MHKLRNTAHIELLEKLFKKYGELKHISKREMRILLQVNNWKEQKVINEIEADIWWCRFYKD